jgi:hypothetical protein
MTAYTAISFNNAGMKGIGNGDEALQTISTGTVNIASADTYTFTFAKIQGLTLRLADVVINGTAAVTAPVSIAVTTNAYSYTIVATLGTVTGTAVGTVGCHVYYA